MLSRLCVIGAGSWGTALAIALAARFEEVALWCRNPSLASDVALSRQNGRYLPGFQLPDGVLVSACLSKCLKDSDIVLIVIPSAYFRATLEKISPHLPENAKLVSASKGIEETTLCRMSELTRSILHKGKTEPVGVLSGPTFAQEVAAGEPAAVVIASENLALAEFLQHALSTPSLRFYVTSDVIGVEIGAALKNIIAIGAGICNGIGLGSNSVAALVTRGLAEISRLAIVLGGRAETLTGLSGLGDLVLTATGHLSRNRSVGVQLGRGVALPTILSSTPMMAEGVGTCRAAYQLGMDHNVDLPIINKMYEILYLGKDPRQAIQELMERPLRSKGESF